MTTSNMVLKIVLAIFLLTIDNGVDSIDVILSPDKMDALLFKILPIGDDKTTLPENAQDYAKICNELNIQILRPSWYAFFAGPALRIKTFRENGFSVFKDKMNSKFCDLAKNHPDDYVKIAKEIKSAKPKLNPIRKGYTKAMVAAAKGDKKITEDQFKCFLKKWIDETSKALSSSKGKEAMKEQLKPYRLLADTTLSKCDWDKFPKADNTKFKSIDMLFFEAAKTVLLSKTGSTTTTAPKKG